MRREKWLLLLGVALLVILVDQVSKAIIVANLDLYEEWAPIEALRPLFVITHVTNTGAAFGILQGGNTLFQIVAVVVVFVILYFYHQLTDRVWLLRVALGLQLGGAAGNLIDRVRQGYVVDFLHLKFWPVSNVSDVCIVAGVGLLLLVMWREDRRQASARPADGASSDEATSDDESATAARQ